MGTEPKFEAGQPAPAVTVSQGETAPKKSRGDKLFDRWLYVGLNGVGTFIITIPLAFIAKYGNNGQELKLFDKITKSLSGLGVAPKYIHEFTMMLATSLGGTAMVLPTWVAEHYRKPIVDSLNGKPADKQNTVTPEAPKEEVYEAPKQTFGSLFRGRLLAMATVVVSFRIAGFFFPKQFDAFEKSVGRKAVELFSEKAKESPKMMRKIYRYGKMAAIDVFATTAATTLLYTGSRFFANHRKTPALQENPLEIPTPALPFDKTLADAPADAAPLEAPATTIRGEKLTTGMVQAQTQQVAAQLS